MVTDTETPRTEAEQHGHFGMHGFCDLCKAAGRAAALGEYLDSLRTRLNDTGTAIAHKGAMEYAVEAAYDDATQPVGDPAEGITMTSMSILADAIVDYLQADPDRPDRPLRAALPAEAESGATLCSSCGFIHVLTERCGPRRDDAHTRVVEALRDVPGWALRDALALRPDLAQRLRAILAAEAGKGLPCARYWGSDGTLCATHSGRFATWDDNVCALAPPAEAEKGAGE